MTAGLSRLAPRAALRLRQTDPAPFATSADRLRGVDGVLMPYGFFSNLPHLDVFEDRWVCIVDVANPEVGDELTVADLSRLPWASTSSPPGTSSMGMRRLVEAGVTPAVQAVVDSFLALPLLVVRTGRIALLPERLGAALEHPRLRVLECPAHWAAGDRAVVASGLRPRRRARLATGPDRRRGRDAALTRRIRR